MKKIFISIILISICFSGFSQTKREIKTNKNFDKTHRKSKSEIRNRSTQIFFEDFQNGMPNTFTLINNDGFTANNTHFGNKAWIIFNDDINPGDSTAASTSYYSSGGTTADDWMITPAITITNGCVLRWNARAFEDKFADGYEVKISTTGTQMTDFATNLFSIPAENIEWQNRSIDLTAYAGQTVHIAFRNNSTDKNLLQIDDIEVYKKDDYDIALTKKEFTPNTDYPIIPFNHVEPIFFNTDVKNIGINSVSSVTLDINVLGTGFSASTTNNNPLTSSSTLSGLTHSSPLVFTNKGTYNAYFNISVPENETSLADNQDSLKIIVSDSTFARETGDLDMFLGLNSYKITTGQIFKLATQDTLTSVSFFTNGPGIGDSCRAQVWEITNNDTILVSSSSLFSFTTASPAWYTLLLDGNYWVFKANVEYIVSIRQASEHNLQLGASSSNFIPGKAFGLFDGEGWMSAEEMGAEVAFAIRANFGSVRPLALYDVAVKSASQPETSCNLGNETMSIVVKNYGQNPINNIPIKMNIDGAITSETISATINSLESYTYTFSTQANLSSLGNHVIKVYSQLGSDNNQTNDTVTISTKKITPSTVPVTMSFESTDNMEGWVIVNNNNDGYTWENDNTQGGAHTGSNFLIYNFSSNFAADDHLFSSCINFEAGKNYDLSFFYVIGDVDYTEKLRVFLMNSQDVNDTVSTIVDINPVTNGTYLESSTIFTVPTTGTYYLDFNIYSDADKFLLVMDDISITESNSIDEKQANTANVYPNPTTDILNIECKEDIKTISIINTIGQVVYSNEIYNNSTKVNTSNFDKGIYLVKIQTENSSIIKKVTIE